jgi:hypothetical protein
MDTIKTPRDGLIAAAWESGEMIIRGTDTLDNMQEADEFLHQMFHVAREEKSSGLANALREMFASIVKGVKGAEPEPESDPAVAAAEPSKHGPH